MRGSGVVAGACASERGGGCVLLLEFAHTSDGLLIGAWEERRKFAEFGSGLQAAPLKVFEVRLGDVAEPELRPDLRGAVRDHRVRERGDDADGLGCDVQDGGAIRLLLFFADVIVLLPRSGGGEEAIDRADQSPQGFERAGKVECLEMAGEGGDGGGDLGLDGAGTRKRDATAARQGHQAVEVAADHRQRAAHQIPVAIRQIRVVALHQRVEREAAVLAEDDLAQQEVAQRVRPKEVLLGFGQVGFERAEAFQNGLRAHDVAARLRHLALFEEQPAVRVYGFGQRQTGGHQERGPVDAVEADDLLADEVQVGGPEGFVLAVVGAAPAQGGDVVGQRIEPDVDDVLLVARHGDAPVEAGAGDGEIAQAALHEGDDFVAARLRPDEVGMLLVELEQRRSKAESLKK